MGQARRCGAASEPRSGGARKTLRGWSQGDSSPSILTFLKTLKKHASAINLRGQNAFFRQISPFSALKPRKKTRNYLVKLKKLQGIAYWGICH